MDAGKTLFPSLRPKCRGRPPRGLSSAMTAITGRGAELVLEILISEAGAIYVVDRAYADFKRQVELFFKRINWHLRIKPYQEGGTEVA